MTRGCFSSRFLGTCVALVALALATTVGCGGDLDSRLAEIRALQDAGQFEDSIEPLRGLVTTNSSHPEVNYRLGLALVQTGRRSLAIWPLNKAADSEEYAVQAGILLSATLLSTEDYAEAVRAADRVLKVDPNNKPALYSRAQGNLYGANPEGVLEDTEKLLALDAKDARALALKVGALIDLERLDESEQIQRDALEEAAEAGDTAAAARACAALSVFFIKTEREDRAEQVHTDCLARFPDEPLVRNSAAEHYEANHRYADAAALFRTAVEKTPEDPALRIRLAGLLLKAGDKRAADGVMTEMVELFDTADAWRQMSKYRRDTGEMTLAREAIEQAIERTQGSAPSLRFELGDLLIAEGEYDRAREIADELDEPAYSQLLLGSIALSQADPQKAIELFESGLRRWPNNAGARYLTGLAAEQLGDDARARTEYREAVRNDETATDGALRLAQMFFADAEYKSSLDFANRHLTSRPFTGPEAHVISARSAAAIGEAEAAQTTLRDLLRRPEHQMQALVEMATIAAGVAGPEAAADSLLAAYEEAPEAAGDADFVRALVGHLTEAGRASKALELAREQLAREDSALNHDLVGRVLMRQGRLDDAKKSFEAALQRDAELAHAHEGLGALAMAGRDFEQARSHYDRAAELDPHSGEYLYRGAQATLALGDRDAAIERLHKTVEVEPANAGACNDLAWLLSETGGDLDLALRLASRATRVQPGPTTRDTLGWVHLKRGDAGQAAAVFQSVISEAGESPARLYHLGLALGQQGETEQALEALRRAVADDGFADAAAASAEIERLEKLL